MEYLLSQEDSEHDGMHFLEEVLTTRMEKEHIGFIITYTATAPISPLRRGKKGKKSDLSLGVSEYVADL